MRLWVHCLCNILKCGRINVFEVSLICLCCYFRIAGISVYLWIYPHGVAGTVCREELVEQRRSEKKGGWEQLTVTVFWKEDRARGMKQVLDSGDGKDFLGWGGRISEVWPQGHTLCTASFLNLSAYLESAACPAGRTSLRLPWLLPKALHSWDQEAHQYLHLEAVSRFAFSRNGQNQFRFPRTEVEQSELVYCAGARYTSLTLNSLEPSINTMYTFFIHTLVVSKTMSSSPSWAQGNKIRTKLPSVHIHATPTCTR